MQKNLPPNALQSQVTVEAASEISSEWTRLISSVFSPFLIAYLYWVITESVSRGTKRLYFVSRDGQILLKLAKEICSVLSINLDLRYLYGSRQAWFRSAIYQIDWNQLDWVTFKSKSLGNIFNRLPIDLSDIGCNAFEEIGLGISDLNKELSSNDLELLKNLISQPSIENLLLKRSSQLRDVALDYFRQEGLFDDISWSLVDIGWGLNSQRALKRLLNRAGWSREMHGYYLAISSTRQPYHEAGAFSAFIEQGVGDRITHICQDWVFNLPIMMILEDVLCIADHGSVIGYRKSENAIEPILNDFMDSEAHRKFIQRYHSQSIQTAREMAPLLKEDFRYRQFARHAIDNLEATLRTPTINTVKLIGSFLVADEQAHLPEHHRPLAIPLGIKNIIEIIRCTLSGKRYSQALWLTGSVTISAPPIRITYFLLFFIYQHIRKAFGLVKRQVKPLVV